MSHEITIREDGFAEVAFSLKPAWHGLGKVYDHVMTSEEAFDGGGCNFMVDQWPIAVGRPEGEAHVWLPQAGHYANVRSDNGLILGMVTDQYKVVQNCEAFGFLDALVENHEMRYESAFTLYGGKKVVLLARMPGVDWINPDDGILRYIVMSLSHDGTESIRFGPCATRVVCANTYSVALGEGKTKKLTIRHTGDIKDKLDAARGILGLASQQFSQYAEVGRQLAQYKLSRSEWDEYLDVMCPEINPKDPDYTDRRANAIMQTRFSIGEAYRNDRQATAKGTAWAAYNAVSEHIDHLPRRGADLRRKAEARFNVCLYGIGRDMKQRALGAACRFADVSLAA